MKSFSEILVESSNDVFVLTSDEFTKYCEVIEKTKRSKEFLHILWLIGQHPELFEQKNMENVLNGKFTCKTVPVDVMKDIFKLAKKAGNEIKLLPQLLTAAQRDLVINKKIDPNDLTLDLESEKGRNEIAKRYMPLMVKLVNQYMDKSPLSKPELLSAAMLGFTSAMNDYKNPEELEKAGKSGNMSFTSYAAYRIKQQILKDLTDNSRNVKISNYYQDKLKDAGEDVNREFSIDRFYGNDEDGEPISIDRIWGLSEEDTIMSKKEEEEFWEKIFKRIECKFSSRDCLMFYKINGVNGYKPEKVKDIAKELGISSPAVVQACNRIIKFIASDKYCCELHKQTHESLLDHYVEQKLLEVYTEDKNKIIESFVCDDIYILMESLVKFTNKEKFQKLVNKATDQLNVDDALAIYKILQNKETLDDKFIKKYKGPVVKFLESVYPDKSFKDAKNDVLVSELEELKIISLKFAIAW